VTTGALPPGLPAVVSSRPLGGGSIADTRVARLADGRTVVVKRTTYDAGLEAEGLTALGAAGAPVPAVLGVGDGVLVIEHVSGAPAWDELGAQVAALHLAPAGDTFGWERDNVIGPLHQANPPTPEWPDFYLEQRLLPHLDAPALPAEVRRRLARACQGPARELLDHDVQPALVHGDLWSGNVVDGRWLVDPAVNRADRELDLAFAALFGGFPERFWRGYDEVAPLDDGWRRRRPALQLYHLLVHVRLFGAGYVGSVVGRLDQLGW
jgi:fructosamine-3-kinase